MSALVMVLIWYQPVLNVSQFRQYTWQAQHLKLMVI